VHDSRRRVLCDTAATVFHRDSRVHGNNVGEAASVFPPFFAAEKATPYEHMTP